jgi:hypothetical protein
VFNTRRPDLGRTWVKIKGKIFGAKPDTRGPIGGGKGYRNVVRQGDCRAGTLDELLDALAKARSGDTVFIDGSVEIDCTERVFIEQQVIEVPEGVTLASDRGVGRSKGALILSDTFATRPLIRIGGPGVRITGMRIQGPDPKRRLEHHDRCFLEGRGHEYYYKFPISDGIFTEHSSLEVDNCELGGWSHGAVSLSAGEGHHIHHCFIHHNQYNGLGYGICHGNAFSLIEQNLFNYNRHSIAGSGSPGSGYEACHNVEIGESLSHCFDMHGGRDRKDGTDIAGTRMNVHHNTFRSRKTPIVIRGVPEEEAEVHHNWFFHHRPEGQPGNNPVRYDSKTNIHANAYGKQRPMIT